MPFINSKVNVSISDAQEKELKSKLAKAIEIIPGKSENWLMLGFEDNCKLYFQGDNARKIAFVEVKIFGSSDKAVLSKVTAEICDVFKAVLDIEPSNVYVKYEEVDNWGWNGSNF